MKTILLLAFFLVLAQPSFGQENNKVKSLPYVDYMMKSKSQYKLGYTLLGVGSAAFVIPIVIYATSNFDVTEIYSPVGPLSILLGAGMIVSSVPILIIAGSNKRKAMSFSFKNEICDSFACSSIVPKSFPSLSLKLAL